MKTKEGEVLQDLLPCTILIFLLPFSMCGFIIVVVVVVVIVQTFIAFCSLSTLAVSVFASGMSPIMAVPPEV